MGAFIINEEAEEKLYDDINITPMLDVAYMLLLIFIIMTSSSIQGISVKLSKTSNTPFLSKPKTKVISITQDGSLFGLLSGSLQELESCLAQFKAAMSDWPVAVKADAAVQYQKVIEVLDVVTRV